MGEYADKFCEQCPLGDRYFNVGVDHLKVDPSEPMAEEINKLADMLYEACSSCRKKTLALEYLETVKNKHNVGIV